MKSGKLRAVESCDILPERVECLDESNIKTSMVRCYGRGKRGERVKGYIPDARWEALSILSSLRIDGSTEAIEYEGGLDGEFFKQWVKDALLRTLHKGDVVIVGAEIKYLPPYSPDLNPIELMWSKIKSELRAQGKVKV